MITRRQLLATSLATAALFQTGLNASAMESKALKFGKSFDFSFDYLISHAKGLAGKPYNPPPETDKALLHAIDYDAHGMIRFSTDAALFADKGSFPVTFFHLGRLFSIPVHMFVVDEGKAREIIYDASYFDMPSDSPARRLPSNVGFAGFRFQESRHEDQSKRSWRTNDWVAFLGASYFRAIGASFQYGLSARGIAIDTASPNKTEEFPVFTQFFLETPDADDNTVTVYALLEGKSVTGAYKFIMKRVTEGPQSGVQMTVETQLFLRDDVEKLGIAPLTSMYWFSKTIKDNASDWRPEVHDSDGLALWTGAGEHIWRPLNNQKRVMTSSFFDKSPKGFGLLQRERSFEHYLDGVHYERRPSAWIEPLEDWGPGAVQLVEIPTKSEFEDNIVAFWVPQAPARAGDHYHFHYRLYWQDLSPFPAPSAEVVATRLGQLKMRDQLHSISAREFIVEFRGEPLTKLPPNKKPEAVLWASRGSFSQIFTEPMPNGRPEHWRTHFELTVEGNEPVELRLFLRDGDHTLSETWAYQYHPS